jgi:hypothetical protein
LLVDEIKPEEAAIAAAEVRSGVKIQIELGWIPKRGENVQGRRYRQKQ